MFRTAFNIRSKLHLKPKNNSIRKFLLLASVVVFSHSLSFENATAQNEFMEEKNSIENLEREINALATPHWLKVGKADTALKINTSSSDTLEKGTEKCTLYTNSLIYLSKAPQLEQNHWKVSLAEPISGCQLESGYVFIDHVSTSDSTSAGESRGTVNAFLSVLGYAEGTNNEYNIRFGGYRFSSYARHPAIIYCSRGLCSDAAGRYQFLTTTWRGIANRLGLRDFSPQSQDKGAIQLLKDIGAYRWLVAGASYQNFSNAVYESNTTWASLPGSPYGQPTKPMSAIWEHFKSKL
jgi:muramidase (phage lysozyme)